jgi:hypothetical protein
VRFNDEENRYLDCLARGLTFEEMAIELGMTEQEVEDFGEQLFDRIFASRWRTIM